MHNLIKVIICVLFNDTLSTTKKDKTVITETEFGRIVVEVIMAWHSCEVMEEILQDPQSC